MATWVRLGTGTAPSNTDADLVGDYALDNGTVPGDWDGTAVNSVRVQWSIVGTNFNDDDSWDDDKGVALETGATEISAHPGGATTGNKNTTVNNDDTDSTISGALSDGQWEAALLRGDGAVIPDEWSTWVKLKGPDGGNQAAASVTVTIDYTPAVAADPFPPPVSHTGTPRSNPPIPPVTRFTRPKFVNVGSLAETQDDQTSAASGQIGVIGSLAETQADQTSAASGQVHFIGSLAETQDDQTSTASGVVDAGALVLVDIFETGIEDLRPDRPQVTHIVLPTEAPITGSLAVTQDDQTSAASGQIGVIGSLAETQDDHTSAASGVFSTTLNQLTHRTGTDPRLPVPPITRFIRPLIPPITGSLAETQDDQTSTASGQIGVSGSLAETQDDQTSTATGQIGVSGSLAETQDDQTSTASGDVSTELHQLTHETGTAARLPVPPVTRFTRPDIPAGPITGSLAETQDDQTVVATGIVWVIGTVAETQDDQTSAAAGQIGVQGTLAETQDDQTSAASGESKIVGSLAETQDDQTSAATGQVGVQGTLAETQDDETSAASGQIGVQGTLAETQDDQTSAASGQVHFIGTVAVTQADQTSAAAGQIGVQGSLAETQEDQTVVATGAVPTELHQLVHRTGTPRSNPVIPPVTRSITQVSGVITGSLAVTQDDQTVAAAGIVHVIGSLAETQDDQTVVATGTFTPDVVVTGSAAVTEQDDTVVAAGIVWNIGSAAITQEDQFSTATGFKYGPTRPQGLPTSGPNQGHTHVSDEPGVSDSSVSDTPGPTRAPGSGKSRVGL